MYLLEELLEQSMTMEATDISEILHQESPGRLQYLLWHFQGAAHYSFYTGFLVCLFLELEIPVVGPSPSVMLWCGVVSLQKWR